MDPIREGKEEKIIVSMGNNKSFQVLDAKEAFGDGFTDEIRNFLIKGTSDDIATLILMQSIEPLIINSGQSASDLIEERKRGLQALGVEDIDNVIKESIEKLKEEPTERIASKAANFMV